MTIQSKAHAEENLLALFRFRVSLTALEKNRFGVFLCFELDSEKRPKNDFPPRYRWKIYQKKFFFFISFQRKISTWEFIFFFTCENMHFTCKNRLY